MDNNQIIEKIYKLQLAVKKKNPMISISLEKATIPLLEYEKELQAATRKDLLKIPGIGNGTVDYILKIIDGENTHSIVKEIPEPKKGRLGEMKWKW